MKIERIFRNIPVFENIVLDTVLFESKYPLMFTCRNNNDIYFFICCLVNAEKVEWIGSKTTYKNLIALLQNEITIRDAFLNVTNEKVIIEYDGQNVDYKLVQGYDIQNELLPSEGEFMDAESDEYIEEIAAFKRRDANVEYVIKPRINVFFSVNYSRGNIILEDEYFNTDMGIFDEMQYNVGKIRKHRVALA